MSICRYRIRACSHDLQEPTQPTGMSLIQNLRGGRDVSMLSSFDSGTEPSRMLPLLTDQRVGVHTKSGQGALCQKLLAEDLKAVMPAPLSEMAVN